MVMYIKKNSSSDRNALALRQRHVSHIHIAPIMSLCMLFLRSSLESLLHSSTEGSLQLSFRISSVLSAPNNPTMICSTAAALELH